MRKLLLLLGICIGIFVLCSPSFAAPSSGYYFAPIYWTQGTVTDSPDVAAEGHQIVFYKDTTEYYSGLYGSDIVGTGGSAKAVNRGMVNVFSNLPSYPLQVGGTYKVAVVQDDKGYGAGPVDIVISGKGYDEFPAIAMAYGAGIPSAPSATIVTTPPYFKEIWFGNRLYHKALVDKGEKFITSKSPVIKAGIEGTGSSGIKQDSIKIVVNEGLASEATYKMAEADLKDKVFITGQSGVVSALNVEYAVPQDMPLPDGDNVLKFYASDHLGLTSTTEVCSVQVMSGPLSVIGPVVTYPSPFSPTKQSNVEIQYTLNTDGDVQIFIYSIAAELMKRLYLYSGREGGSAGLNKIKWDGKSTFNEMVGNGIYMGTIFSKTDNKTLAKFKLTVVH